MKLEVKDDSISVTYEEKGSIKGNEILLSAVINTENLSSQKEKLIANHIVKVSPIKTIVHEITDTFFLGKESFLYEDLSGLPIANIKQVNGNTSLYEVMDRVLLSAINVFKYEVSKLSWEEEGGFIVIELSAFCARKNNIKVEETYILEPKQKQNEE